MVVFLRPGNHFCRSLQAMRDDPLQLFFAKSWGTPGVTSLLQQNKINAGGTSHLKKEVWDFVEGNEKQKRTTLFWRALDFWPPMFGYLVFGSWLRGDLFVLLHRKSRNLVWILFNFIFVHDFPGFWRIAHAVKSQEASQADAKQLLKFQEKWWHVFWGKAVDDDDFQMVALGIFRLMSVNMWNQQLFRQTVFVAILAIAGSESVLSDQFQQERCQHRCLPAPLSEQTAGQKPLSLNSASHHMPDEPLTIQFEPYKGTAADHDRPMHIIKCVWRLTSFCLNSWRRRSSDHPLKP